jgi:hypothetical protein
MSDLINETYLGSDRLQLKNRNVRELQEKHKSIICREIIIYY